MDNSPISAGRKIPPDNGNAGPSTRYARSGRRMRRESFPRFSVILSERSESKNPFPHRTG